MEEFKMKPGVKWSVHITSDVQEKFDNLTKDTGKINKSKLVNYLLSEYLKSQETKK